jgi:ribosomal protein L11 methylase PrmA
LEIQITKQNTTSNKYEPYVVLHEKVYPKMHYNEQPIKVVVDKILAKIKT